MLRPLLLLGISLNLTLLGADKPERPNILWITSEDNSAHWIGCYGNEQAKTPRIDALADEGHLFLHAYSNAPVCAVARSTILNGAYAVTQGTQHMRSRHPIPERFKSYVSYLRGQGYYCTNSSKTDFNFKGDDRAIWDECSGKAHYKNRAEGQPFMAVFNLTVSHESSLFPNKRGKEPRRLAASEVDVPPYLPDLPEVRKDIAAYHDKITTMDGQVGELLDELEKAGLAEDTIVFYYSDHGGVTPRGKRYIKETGVHVPMVVHVPTKWGHLTPFKRGGKVDEPVAFVDLAPTLLSLIGLEKPDAMQGRAFLGEHREAAPEDDMVFLYADRFDELYGMRRGITDGRWKYIRRFTPQLAAAPYSFYQFSMPSWVAYRKAWQDGELDGVHKAMWEAPQVEEELFDLKSDPWEVRNLAADPAHAERLVTMRARLKGKMTEVKDTGLVPEPMWAALAGGKPIADFVRSSGFDFQAVLDLAFLASRADLGEVGALMEFASSDDPVKRYWALQGLQIAGQKAGLEAILTGLRDEHSVNRVTAAEALCRMGKEKEGRAAMLKELMSETHEYSLQYLINALMRVDAIDDIPEAWVNETLKDRKAGAYVKRFAERIKSGEL